MVPNMSCPKEEIARDIVVAAINQSTVPMDGKQLGQLYKDVLLGVREAWKTFPTGNGD